MQNYFNYFTEIEEHFQRRRGSLLLLSTIDWALIETWREAGVPLAAVIKGIDTAFDKYDARKNKARVRRVNGLAYCAQEVISAMEEMKEAAVGAAPARMVGNDELVRRREFVHPRRPIGDAAGPVQEEERLTRAAAQIADRRAVDLDAAPRAGRCRCRHFSSRQNPSSSCGPRSE